jgi:phosphotransferase system HPr-like phosphotransfer protein
VLQKEFGIGAREALFERPAWELDNLLARYREQQQREEA